MSQGYIPGQPKKWQASPQQEIPPVQPQAQPQPQYAPHPQQGYQQPAYQHQPMQPQAQSHHPYQHGYQPQPVQAADPKVSSKRSIFLLISAAIALIFLIVLVPGTFSQADKAMSQNATTAEQVGFQLGTMLGAALIIPQMIATDIAFSLNAVGWGIRNRGCALAGAIVYCVAAVLMIINAPFLLPSIVLSFVGYSQMGKAKVKNG